jgi:hypothetical protein
MTDFNRMLTEYVWPCIILTLLLGASFLFWSGVGNALDREAGMQDKINIQYGFEHKK